MSVFIAKSNKGNLSLGSEYNRSRFKQDLKDNHGAKYRIQRITPESREMRGFFEGGVVPLACYYQDNLDHRNNEHIKIMREWLKQEFNSEWLTISGKAHKVPKSSKGGGTLKKIIEKTVDWLEDQGADTTVLNPKEYKDWRDTIFPFEGPENYIDYLKSIKRI